MAPPDIAGVAYSGDFYRVITAAVADIAEHGYDSQERVTRWLEAIRRAAVASMIDPAILEQRLTDAMRAVYRKLVERGEIARYHPGVGRFTIQRLAPKLHGELEKRIVASAELIQLNREQAIQTTLRRFSGWATSIPDGGSAAVAKVPVKTDIRKALAQLPYEERRVLIDQGHKFRSALSNIIATDGGALAMIWHSHWRQPGYNYRPDHKERDGKVYATRGNWAAERGLVRRGLAGYADEITAPAEEVFCRCAGQYLYALRDLPADMLTRKGRDELEKARVAA